MSTEEKDKNIFAVGSVMVTRYVTDTPGEDGVKVTLPSTDLFTPIELVGMFTTAIAKTMLGDVSILSDNDTE